MILDNHITENVSRIYSADPGNILFLDDLLVI
jgi:hypothetical protein